MSVAYINLTKNKVTIVDLEDLEKVIGYSWYSRKSGRANIYYADHKTTKVISMHRLIMNAKKGEHVDHINHDGLDNRKCNLRICTNKQNSLNARKVGTFTSIYKGVCKSINMDKIVRWKAQIQLDGKQINLGKYLTEREAAIVYDYYARKHFKEFALTNFNEPPKFPLPKRLHQSRKSKYKGVRASSNQWRSVLYLNNSCLNLGTYSTELKAAIAYDYSSYKHFKNLSKLNFKDRIPDNPPLTFREERELLKSK